MPHPYYPIYDYFTGVGAEFVNKEVLDFGGNQGNLLKSSNGAIQQRNYTSLDVDPAALALGRYQFPNATWIHYNRFNPAYNKYGDENERPPLTKNYDIIIANSVFTHTSIEEIEALIPVLYSHLTDNGSIWFTWCNIDYKPCYKFFEEMRIKKFGNCDPLPDSDVAYMCDNKIQDTPTLDNELFVSFFRESFILNRLKEFNPINHKPFEPWPMDCIEIRKEIK